jgi:hypothetical protein
LVVIVKRELRSGFYAGELGHTSETRRCYHAMFHDETFVKHETLSMHPECPQVLENRVEQGVSCAGTAFAFTCPYSAH